MHLLDIGPLSFKTIELPQSESFCIQFRVDSYVVSFGDASQFYKECGADGAVYIDWLQKKLSKDPASAVHIWEGGSIIGQMELGVLKDNPQIGNVNLYYLVPDKRGLGYSAYLDAYAIQYLKNRGLSKSRLSVSPTNTRAIRFYEKNGWKDIGPRSTNPLVHWMEKSF
jgi:GNAT superfamily N-acetyltransferase